MECRRFRESNVPATSVVLRTEESAEVRPVDVGAETDCAFEGRTVAATACAIHKETGGGGFFARKESIVPERG